MFRSIKLTSEIGQSVTISENANDYVLDESGLNLGQASATQNMTQYIDLIGKHIDSIVIQPRDLAIIGWIIGDTETIISKRKRLLNRVINPMYNITLEIGDYALDFSPDSSIQYSPNYQENNEYMCKFQIQGTAAMPLFRLKDYSIYGETSVVRSNFHFPFAIPKEQGIMFGYYPFSSFARMPNMGDVESGFTFVCKASNGNAINPGIENLTTGTNIGLNYTLLDGETLEICTEIGKQYIKIIDSSGNEINGMKYLTSDSEIDMTLALGINKLVLVADGDTSKYLTAKAIFSPRFLEVEGR